MIGYEYIDGLNTFMQTAHNCKNNGAVNLLCCPEKLYPLCDKKRMDREESVPVL